MSCTGTDASRTEALNTSFSAAMASSWHYVGRPPARAGGVLASDADGIRPVTQGTIEISFGALGTDGGGGPRGRPPMTARYIPVPGTEASGDAPAMVRGPTGSTRRRT